MSLNNPDYTNRPAIVTAHDPHPNLEPSDFSRIVRNDREVRNALGTQAERNALGDEVVTENDKKLEAFQTVQQDILLAVAIKEIPSLKGKSREQIINTVNNLQVGSSTEISQYVKINAEMISQATTALEAKGLDGASLGTILQRKISAAGTTLAGIPGDLSKISTTGLVTIAAAAGIPYLLGGGKWWVGGLTTLAVTMQSPNAVRAVIATGSGVVRGAKAIIGGHIATAYRGLDVINSIGSGESMTNILYAHAQGFTKDLMAPVGYAFDRNYDPNAAGANASLQEYYHLGKDYTPSAFKPLLGQLQNMRELQPPTVTTLPTRAQLKAAGLELKMAEGLVKRADYDRIQAKRVNGEPLTAKDNQQYILFKYCDIIRTYYIGPNALQPQGSIVQMAYDRASGTSDINNLIPLRGQLNDPKFLELPEAKRNGMIKRTEAWANSLTLEQLTKYGFVGLAGGAILTLMLAGATFGVIQKSLGLKKTPEEKKAGKENPSDDATLERAWYNPRLRKQGRYKTLEGNVRSGKNGDALALYNNLTAFSVLTGSSTLATLIKENNAALDIQNSEEFQDLRAMLHPNSGKTRAEIRAAFFKALIERNDIDGLKLEVERLKNFNNISYQVRKLYKIARNGSGKTAFTINTKDAGGGTGSLDVSINRENDFGERLHYISGLFTGVPLKDRVRSSFVLRYVTTGEVSNNTARTKAVKFTIDPNDGKVYVQSAPDRVFNIKPGNWVWGEKLEITSFQ